MSEPLAQYDASKKLYVPLAHFFEAAECSTQSELAEFLGIRQSGVRSIEQQIRIKPGRVFVHLVAAGLFVVIAPLVFQSITRVSLKALSGQMGRLHLVGFGPLVDDRQLVAVGNRYAGFSAGGHIGRAS